MNIDKVQQIKPDPDLGEDINISDGFRMGDLLVISGQTAMNEDGVAVGGNDFDKQAEAAFANLEKVLKAGGSDLDHVVKVTIYVTDMGYYPRVLELREKHFSKPYPADTIVEVTSLAKPEFLIEIEAFAVQNDIEIE